MKYTLSVIGICVALFITFNVILIPIGVVSFNFFEKYLVFTPDNLLSGRVWTLVTAMFIHGGWSHLLFNMMVFFMVGSTLEKVFGGWKMLLVYFTAGIISFLIGIPVYGNVPTLGNSAAVFGVMGTLALVNPVAYKVASPVRFFFHSRKKEIGEGTVTTVKTAEIIKERIDPKTLLLDFLILTLAQFTLLLIYGGMSTYGSTGHVAHIIGFAVGIIFGVIFSPVWQFYIKYFAIIVGILLLVVLLFYLVSHVIGLESIYEPIDDFLYEFGIILIPPDFEELGFNETT